MNVDLAQSKCSNFPTIATNSPQEIFSPMLILSQVILFWHNYYSFSCSTVWSTRTCRIAKQAYSEFSTNISLIGQEFWFGKGKCIAVFNTLPLLPQYIYWFGDFKSMWRFLFFKK